MTIYEFIELCDWYKINVVKTQISAVFEDLSTVIKIYPDVSLDNGQNKLVKRQILLIDKLKKVPIENLDSDQLEILKKLEIWHLLDI